jgi:hypothetical protein
MAQSRETLRSSGMLSYVAQSRETLRSAHINKVIREQ